MAPIGAHKMKIMRIKNKLPIAKHHWTAQRREVPTRPSLHRTKELRLVPLKSHSAERENRRNFPLRCALFVQQCILYAGAPPFEALSVIQYHAPNNFGWLLCVLVVSSFDVYVPTFWCIARPIRLPSTRPPRRTRCPQTRAVPARLPNSAS